MRNNAFTMVELLAATVLSTLLFVTALAVIRSLASTVPKENFAPQSWTPAARRQLEWDVTNAVVIRRDDHGLILAGYDSLDPQTLLPNHLPVTVVYSMKTIDSRIWLVREQTSLDPLLTTLNFSEPICGDVKSFTVTGSYAPRTFSTDPKDPANDQSDDDATPVVFQQLTGFERTPDRMRVRLDLRADPVPVMNSVIYLR